MKRITFAFIVILFQACRTCPEQQSLEFTKSTKNIRLLSEDYYIKSIRVTEYLPKEGHIATIDSNYIEFVQYGVRAATEISLNNTGENYTLKGNKDFKKFLDKDYLEYVIRLEKFENKRNGDFDKEVIRFVSTTVKKEKNIFQSNHLCP